MGGGFTVGGGAGRQCFRGYTVGATVGGCGRGVGRGRVGAKMLGVLWERALRPLEIRRWRLIPRASCRTPGVTSSRSPQAGV